MGEGQGIGVVWLMRNTTPLGTVSGGRSSAGVAAPDICVFFAVFKTDFALPGGVIFDVCARQFCTISA